MERFWDLYASSGQPMRLACRELLFEQRWPLQVHESIDLRQATLDDIEFRINEGYLLCGDPDEVIAQVERYESVGADQLVFGMPIDMPMEAAEETLRLFGDHVIPKFDKDPVHRSSKFRAEAEAASEATGGSAASSPSE